MSTIQNLIGVQVLDIFSFSFLLVEGKLCRVPLAAELFRDGFPWSGIINHGNAPRLPLITDKR